MPTTPQLEISKEMRAVAGQSVEHAKETFDKFMQSAKAAVSTFEKRVEASQSGALDISKKAMSFAEQNVLSAFELAQKIVQAYDLHGIGPNAKPVRSVTDAGPNRAGADSQQIVQIVSELRTIYDLKEDPETADLAHSETTAPCAEPEG